MSQTHRLTPVGEALRNCGIRQKAWRDLVEARLITRAQRRIPGTKTYALTNEQVERLSQITIAKDELSQRYTLAALAYQLGADGIRDDAVAKLAKKEAQKRVKSFIGTLRRIGQRAFKLSSAKRRMDDEQIHNSVNNLMRRVTRKSKRVTPLAKDWTRFVLTMVLRTLYGTGGIEAQERDLRELLLASLSVRLSGLRHVGLTLDEAQKNASIIVTGVSEAVRFAKLDPTRNRLLLKSTWKCSDNTFWLAFDRARQLLAIWWPAYDALQKEFPLPAFDFQLKQHFEGFAVAMIVALQADRDKTEDFQRLMKGDFDGVRAALKSLVVMAATMKHLHAFSKGTKQ